MSEKMTLGVFYGSRTCEHDVSVISALQLMKQIDRSKYDLIPVYIAQDGTWYTGEALLDIHTYTPFDPHSGKVIPVQLDMLTNAGVLIHREHMKFVKGEKETVVGRIDCAIPVFHGLHGEDGTMQGLFELYDIPYTSTGICGSAVGMDKAAMKLFFRGCGFPVLPGIVAERRAWEKDREKAVDALLEQIALPVFVKPCCLGSSIGVSRARTREELEESLEVAFSFDRKALVEQALDSPVEVNCSVLGYGSDAKASVLEMPSTGSADFLDYSEKYLVGNKGMAGLKRRIPAPISEEMTAALQKMSVEVFAALDCKGVVRIDYMIDRATQQYYITEINTIPGSMAYYLWEASGMPYPKLIDRMVEIALEALEDKKQNNYAFRSEILRQVNLGGGTKKHGKL